MSTIPSEQITREAVVAAGKLHKRPGISNRQALLLGYADLSGQSLDPEEFDDAAVLLRAERLMLDGLKLREALVTAKEEGATWGIGE